MKKICSENAAAAPRLAKPQRADKPLAAKPAPGRQKRSKPNAVADKASRQSSRPPDAPTRAEALKDLSQRLSQQTLAPDAARRPRELWSDEVKRFAIELLACFRTPTETVRAIKEQFDLDVTRQEVHAYDASKASRGRLSEPLRELYWQCRNEYLSQVQGVGIGNQKHRLALLERLLDMAMERGALALAADIIKQCAQEVGGVFTNARVITGREGGPIEVDLSTEKRAEQIRAIFAAAAARSRNNSESANGQSTDGQVSIDESPSSQAPAAQASRADDQSTTLSEGLTAS